MTQLPEHTRVVIVGGGFAGLWGAMAAVRQLDDAGLAAAGMTPGMVRISIGLEDASDVIEDLDQALR